MLKRTQQSFNSTFKPRTKGLANGGRLPTSSVKGRAAKRETAKAYDEVDATSNGCCFSCHRWAPLDHSHIFPKGMNQRLRAIPANIVLECRACHDLWSDKLPRYASLYPKALQQKVERMEQIDRSRWAVWMMKNSHLLA